MINQVSAAAFLHQEKDTVTKGWHAGIRLDGRKVDEPRALQLEYPFPERGQCILRSGDTAVEAAVRCELQDPAPHAPKQGFLDFVVRGDVSKGAASDIVALMDQLLKRGKALDTEALCVLPGRKVWSLRVEVIILNNDGNVVDTAVWAALAALMHFRRLELSIRNDEVTIHAADDRDPIPLSIHHIPVPVTAVLPPPLQTDVSGNIVSVGGSSGVLLPLVDPSAAEFASGSGFVTVSVNGEGEICSVQKHGGQGVSYKHIQQCMVVAKNIAPLVINHIKSVIQLDEQRRKRETLEKFTWAQTRVGVGKAAQAAAPAAPAAAAAQSEDEPPTKRRRKE